MRIAPHTVRRFVDLVAAVVLCVAFVRGLLWSLPIPSHDFRQFWMVGEAIERLPVTNVYSAADRRLLLAEYGSARHQEKGRLPELAGTPFLYATFSLASTGNYELDLRVFRIASAVSFLLATLGLALLFGYPFWAAVAIYLFVTYLASPYRMEVVFGNLNRLQVGLLAAYAWLVVKDTFPRRTLGAFILGLLCVAKPNLLYAVALLPVYWAATGRWNRLLPFASGGALAVLAGWLVPAWLFGPACTWSHWLRDHPSILYTDWYLTGGLLGKLTGTTSLAYFTVLGLGLFALAAAFVVLVARWARSGGETAQDSLAELSVLGIGVALYLLSGPIVHSHYFLLLVPWCLLVLRPAVLASRLSRELPWGLAAVFLLSAHPLFRKLHLTAWPNHSLWTFAGATIVLGLLCAGLPRLVSCARART